MPGPLRFGWYIPTHGDGNNEYLTIDNLNMGCELMYEIVRRKVT